jgi:O-antigen/teichoic acid export membrane protein
LRTRLAGRDTLRQAVDNSFWLFAEQLFRMGMGLVVGVWLARYLGPTQFGLFSYAVAVVVVVSSFTSLGINAVVVRELVREPAATEALLGTAFFLKSAGAGAGVLVCAGMAWWRSFPEGHMRLLIMVMAAGMLFQTMDVIDLLFQSRAESRFSAWIRMGACLLGNLAKIGLILGRAPLAAFAAAGTAELFLSAAGLFWMARARGGRLTDWRCERERMAALLRQSWPLAVSSVAIYTQAYADQVMLGAMLGGGALGQYAAAMKIVGVFAFLPIIVQTVSAPEIMRAKRDDEMLYRRRLHNLYRLMFVLFLAVGLPLIVLGPAVVKWLYGVSYAGAGALLPWLAFRLFLTNFGVARSVFMVNEGLLRFALITALAGAVVNLGLNFVLIPRWGAIGAIASSLASFTVTIFALECFQPQARANLRLMALAVLSPWRRNAD